jgi:small nuclear ribonucleoprotein (snRNP)-like protein
LFSIKIPFEKERELETKNLLSVINDVKRRFCPARRLSFLSKSLFFVCGCALPRRLVRIKVENENTNDFDDDDFDDIFHLIIIIIYYCCGLTPKQQVELKSGEVYRGTLVEAEDNWNCQLTNVSLTGRDGAFFFAKDHRYGRRPPRPTRFTFANEKRDDDRRG